MTDGVMWQCRECCEFFESTEDVEIWYDDEPFHRDCLKDKAREEMNDPEPLIDEIERKEVYSLDISSEGVLLVKTGEKA